jgi:hypothetical protein
MPPSTSRSRAACEGSPLRQIEWPKPFLSGNVGVCWYRTTARGRRVERHDAWPSGGEANPPGQHSTRQPASLACGFINHLVHRPGMGRGGFERSASCNFGSKNKPINSTCVTKTLPWPPWQQADYVRSRSDGEILDCNQPNPRDFRGRGPRADSGRHSGRC